MSKRSEIIKYLLDLGLDVDTRNYNIKAYKNDGRVVMIGEWGKYQIQALSKFEEYFGNKANEVFMKIAEYCCIDVENRSKK